MDDKDSPIYHANYNERFDALMHHIIVNLGGLREDLFAKIYNKDTKPDFIRTFTHKSANEHSNYELIFNLYSIFTL